MISKHTIHTKLDCDISLVYALEVKIVYLLQRISLKFHKKSCRLQLKLLDRLNPCTPVIKHLPGILKPVTPLTALRGNKFPAAAAGIPRGTQFQKWIRTSGALHPI